VIYVDDNHIKVGGTVLPGVVKSFEIKEDALIDEQDVEGSTKKTKQATGYDDAKIIIEIILDDGETETVGAKITKIQNLFRNPTQEKPVVHEMINSHLSHRNVKKVIFKTFGTKEENNSGQKIASLEFWAYNPVTITASKKTTAPKTPVVTVSPAVKKPSVKTTYSPAVDNARTDAYNNKLRQYTY